MMQGNAGVGAGDHQEWERDGRAARRGDSPAAANAAGERGRRRFRNIRLNRQFAPLLVGITLLCTLGLTGLAYVGARSYAVTGAEARALQDIQVERQLILPQGAAPRLQDGQLVVKGTSAPLVLNGDTTLVDQTRSLTGDDATIYQAEGSRLVAVATDLPVADSSGVAVPGSRALGDVLTGPALDAVQGTCTLSGPPSCHQTYQGTITVRGLSYAAALVPLYDANGTYVGALGVAEPLDTVVAPAVQLSVVLLVAALLLAVLALVIGFWLFGALAERALGTLDLRLRLVADAASEVERLAQLQATRAERQERVARQASEQARALDAMAEVMEQGRASLRVASGDVWAEMSQPGMLADPIAAVRLAQQAAVAAAQVGSAAEDARDACHQLVGLMNHIIAEGAIVGDGGLEMETRAKDLRAAVESVEVTVGERLFRRSLFLQRVRAASQRVRHFLPAPFGLDSRPADADTDDTPQHHDEPPAKMIEPHPMASWTWPTPVPEPAAEEGDFDSPPHLQPVALGPHPTPHGLPPRAKAQPCTPQPLQQQQQQQQQRRQPQQQGPRTPPRLVRNSGLPPGVSNARPGSGLLSGARDSSESSLPRGGRQRPESPRDDLNPSGSKHSGWLG